MVACGAAAPAPTVKKPSVAVPMATPIQKSPSAPPAPAPIAAPAPTPAPKAPAPKERISTVVVVDSDSEEQPVERWTSDDELPQVPSETRRTTPTSPKKKTSIKFTYAMRKRPPQSCAKEVGVAEVTQMEQPKHCRQSSIEEIEEGDMQMVKRGPPKRTSSASSRKGSHEEEVGNQIDELATDHIDELVADLSGDPLRWSIKKKAAHARKYFIREHSKPFCNSLSNYLSFR